MSEEILVTDYLPDNGERVLAYGCLTRSGTPKINDQPDWYEAEFSFVVLSYKIKKQPPENPSDFILESITAVESWEVCASNYEYLLDVSKWKRL